MKKLVIFLLVVINLGLWFGPQLLATGHAPQWLAARLQPPPADENAASVRLGSDDDGAVRLLDAAVAVGRPTCLRIGPFSSESALGKAAVTLGKLGIVHESVAVSARRVESWRVFLGPFTDEATVRRNRQWLNQSGERDHFVVREDGRMLVSLGVFTQRRTAAAKQRAMTDALALTPDIRREMRRLQASHWLETVQPLNIGVLRPAQWGDPNATLRPLRCPE